MPAPTLTGFAPTIALDEDNAAPLLRAANVVFADVEGELHGGTLTPAAVSRRV